MKVGEARVPEPTDVGRTNPTTANLCKRFGAKRQIKDARTSRHCRLHGSAGAARRWPRAEKSRSSRAVTSSHRRSAYLLDSGPQSDQSAARGQAYSLWL